MVVGDFATEADVVIVGAGPGGYGAAIRLAQLGRSVLLVEKDRTGGVCLHRGCIPSKALISAAHRYEQAKRNPGIGIMTENVMVNFPKVQEWKSEVVNQLSGGVASLLASSQVQVIRGEAYFVNERTISVVDGDKANRYRFHQCIIATGSRPVEWRGTPFRGRVLSSTEALQLAEIPKSLIVIGGGYIGVELGQMFAKFGSKVTVIESSEALLPGFEPELTRYVLRSFQRLHADVHADSSVMQLLPAEDGVTVEFRTRDQEKRVEAEYALVTIGRRPNTDDMGLKELHMTMTERGHIQIDRHCRTSIPGIYAVGDAVEGPALAHKAIYEGKIAAESIAGLPSVIDYTTIPAVVFSDPEIASVGLTQREAERQGYVVTIGKSSYRTNGRSLTMGEPEGFVKLVGERRSGKVLGGQIVGSGASDVIAELGLAIEMGATLEDISLTVHAHPTLSESSMEAASRAFAHDNIS